MTPGVFRNLATLIIEKIDPTATRPDEISRSEFRAPDFSLFSGKILVELKSLNPIKSAYTHLEEIAKIQNRPFYVFGKTSSQNILRGLPNPASANMKLNNRLMRAMCDSIHNARKQFAEHDLRCPHPTSTRILIITDNSVDCSIDTTSFEREIGRQMGGLNDFPDQTGKIDAIIYIRNPTFVLETGASYWMKILRKSNATDFASIIHFVQQFRWFATLQLFSHTRDLHENRFCILKV